METADSPIEIPLTYMLPNNDLERLKTEITGVSTVVYGH